MDCFVALLLAMTSNPSMTPRSRGAMRPSCAKPSALKFRGRRECRALNAPAASCVKKQTHELVTTVTPDSPGIPRAMVLRLTSRSPRRPGFVVTVACASSRRLDANPGAPEPHDLAVRFSIIRQLRCSVHRIPPRVRDDRETPLWGTGRQGIYY